MYTVNMGDALVLMEICLCFVRLEVQGTELGKEVAGRETGSLGAASDCASTRGMAGSITSSYTLPDRCGNLHYERNMFNK